MKCGVLALQGCINPHLRLLSAIGVNAIKVRDINELKQCDRLIIPGGESTTMLTLLKKVSLFEALREFCLTKPVWGICAGAILLAKEVRNPSQESLAVMNIAATRNYYGCQLDSFKALVTLKEPELQTKVSFIRAPALKPLSAEVRTLASHNGLGVHYREGNLMASAFHIELGDETALHRYFMSI
ncbi:MAG: pyridoxal 5'-phosphate synthase glutaminase subunit PdxT [Candidatus Dadabacteria bacterium]|nr:MAG: pyridoxal 5'-phosphate synthase glutaminase subunit PdxT [Candidatus Dadabacteria bacterium]